MLSTRINLIRQQVTQSVYDLLHWSKTSSEKVKCEQEKIQLRTLIRSIIDNPGTRVDFYSFT